MKKIPILFVMLAIATHAIAQTEKKPVDWESNLYFGVSSSTYLDIVKSPITMVNRFVGNDPDPLNPNGVIPRYREVPYQTLSWSIFSVGLEPRYNIKQINDNAALAVSIPISFGIGQTSSSNSEVGGHEGFGSLQLPLMFKYYMGNGSTYDCEKNYGLSFGMGIEYNKLGLINTNTVSEDVVNKGFFVPVASVGFTIWRMNTPFEINLKGGYGRLTEYDVDVNGQPLKDGAGFFTVRQARSSSFKLSFIRLLNF